MDRVSATEARVHFGAIMRRAVEDETPILVERGGKPQVVVLSFTEYERLKGGAPIRPGWLELARRSREQIREQLAGRRLPRSEDVIREAREIRDEQLLGDLYRREPPDSAGS